MHKFFSSEHSVSISPATIIFTVFFLLSLALIYYVRDILLMLFLAIILMSALSPGVRWFERRLRFPRIVGILIMYIFILLILGLVLVVVIPPLITQVPNFVAALSLPPLPDHIRNLEFTLSEVSGVVSQLQNSFGAVFDIITSTFNTIFSFFTVLVLTSYLLIDRERLYKKIGWISSNPHHLDLAKEYIDTLEVHLGGWVRGQVFLMLTIGLMTYIGLSLLSVPYALALGLIAGFLEVLPNLGPTLAAIPGVFVAYIAFGPGMAGFVAIFYIIVQQLENNFIVPKIMKANVDVNPLTTIMLILIGFKLANVMGALLAVPAYIVVRAAYSIWVREQKETPSS